MAGLHGPDLANALKKDVEASAKGSKRLKLRTLLGKFGVSKRSDGNTGQITEWLGAAGVSINPPIVRLGDEWTLGSEDWVYLSTIKAGDPASSVLLNAAPVTLDEWFSRLESMQLRTEKEVEIKFVVPLLARLGYGDDDRFDGMPVPAAHGSRSTTLVIDFALFNASVEALKNQPLLTVEAKKENRIAKQHELLSAHDQAKSYCLWTQCDYFMVTDSRTVQVFHIARGRINEVDPLFACERKELAERFQTLHGLISKDVLTLHYLRKIATTEEAK